MLYDLTLTLAEPLPAFEGDPPFSLSPERCIAQDGYSVSALRMATHSGTHVDVPAHVFTGAMDAEAIPLSAFAGEAFVIPARVSGGFAALPPECFESLKKGDIALIYTGWDEHFRGSDYLIGYPAFKLADMQNLIKLGVKAIGTDLPSFDVGAALDVHRMLLREGVMLIESLAKLGPLANKRCFFSAAPLKLRNGDGSPVRAYAII